MGSISELFAQLATKPEEDVSVARLLDRSGWPLNGVPRGFPSVLGLVPVEGEPEDPARGFTPGEYLRGAIRARQSEQDYGDPTSNRYRNPDGYGPTTEAAYRSQEYPGLPLDILFGRKRR